MELQIGIDCGADFDSLQSREWLETNGLGGWSSSTLSGAHSRSYHGLLVVADNAPVDRKVLVSKLVEEVLVGDVRYELDTNNYSGAVHPKGYEYLKKFERPLKPIFHFETPDFKLSKSIIFIHNTNTLVVRYKLTGASRVKLKLRPFLANRGIHVLNENGVNTDTSGYLFDAGTLNVPMPYESIRNLKIRVPGSEYESSTEVYNNFFYSMEQERGIACCESLLVPGSFELDLSEDEDLYVVLSTDDKAADGKVLYDKEIARRVLLLENFQNSPHYIQQLVLSADQFVVKRSSNLNSIIAGYHWFTDWGRDTMIALPGLCLVTGRFEEAKKILFAFAEVIDKGMIPNRFPENPHEVEYNTVDATLWYVVAIYKYYEYTKDRNVIEVLFPVIDEIVRWHFRGTRYGIKVDSDGLIRAGEDGVQLTWMDAKAGDWVVTPRIGKPIEINALWYNVLCIGSELSMILDNPLSQSFYGNLADEVKKRVQENFYLVDKGYLIDVLGCADGDDVMIRPNQIFALSLPFPLFEGVQAKNIVDTVEKHLLTKYGLRSLSPQDEKYRPFYTGDVWSRDGAYHQGTTWSWLIGAFITAKMRFGGAGKEEECRAILKNFEEHMYEYGIASISEIFDGEESFHARGCVAQAWSVAEIIRVYFEDIVD